MKLLYRGLIYGVVVKPEMVNTGKTTLRRETIRHFKNRRGEGPGDEVAFG